MTKFNNRKTIIDGNTFDSRGESLRYTVLKDRVERGFITNLNTHVPFAITINGVKVCRYVADFTYDRDGQSVVEDFKSKATITSTFRLKAKLMKAVHGIDVQVVMTPEAA